MTAGRQRPGHAVRLREVPLSTAPTDALRGELTRYAWAHLQDARDEVRVALAGRTLWMVNSSATGGGVAEMMRTLLPYVRGSGVAIRWLVLDAPPEFFRLTKRLHNLLHGLDEQRPGPQDRALFEAVARTAATGVSDAIRPGDVVVLHDPQTAGLVKGLRHTGATIVWRSHVGADTPTDASESAWRFLLPDVEPADAVVFVLARFVPAALQGHLIRLVEPAIDPRSAKNRPLDARRAEEILAFCGLAGASRAVDPLRMGTQARISVVHRRCDVLHDGRLPRLGRDRLVVALARWDRLKDPVGIMHAFGRVADPSARLVLAGPAVGAVADDPEGGRVLTETRAAWQQLPASRRRRIVVATLPMADLDENALIVNALQRQADVVVKKSLQEGFGLGVTEALWKARPVVATGVGGHRRQIQHQRSGLLVDDLADASAFAAAIDELLAGPEKARAMGAVGREHVREHNLADRHFVAWAELLAALESSRGRRARVARTRPRR